jgi:hypothetical protein
MLVKWPKEETGKVLDYAKQDSVLQIEQGCLEASAQMCSLRHTVTYTLKNDR